MKNQYAVFGNPIAHSKSPLIHALFAEQTKQHIEYHKQLIEENKFADAAKKFFADGGKGLNVTVPFKLDAFRFSDTLSNRAKLAGAVNTLKLMPDGKVFGDNTDGCGLVRDMMQNKGLSIKGKVILMLGAGGAVRGVLGPLLEENPKEIMIANRTFEKAKELKNLFHGKGNITTWDLAPPIPDIMFDLIINGTSASLSGDEQDLSNLINAVNVSESIFAYDMAYGKPSPFAHMSVVAQSNVSVPLNLKLKKDTTPFQYKAESRGIPTSDGLGMLVEQAAESFFIWRGIKPETKSVIDEVRRQL